MSSEHLFFTPADPPRGGVCAFHSPAAAIRSDRPDQHRAGKASKGDTPWYKTAYSAAGVACKNGLDRAATTGKGAVSYFVGVTDALTAFRTVLGVQAETPLPWRETAGDLALRKMGYGSGMGLNLALAAVGTYMSGHGMATATTCVATTAVGLVTAETGVGAVVAAGGAACTLEGLAEAGVGAALAGFGASNLAGKGNYAMRRGDPEDRMGGNRRQNRQFRAAAARELRVKGIDPRSPRGMTILKEAHRELHVWDRSQPGIDVCRSAIRYALPGAGAAALASRSPEN